MAPTARQFDPRFVRAGIVVLICAALYGVATGQQAANTAGRVAGPVSQVCDAGGPAAAALTATVVDGVNGCQAAADATQVGPFITTLVGRRGATGDAGIPGTPGTPGADATPAPPLPAIPGKDGADGQSPPCLSEPAQCQGKAGADATPPPAPTPIPGPPPPCVNEPGQCRGADGVGIADTQVTDCRLIVTYTNGTTKDAGPVCATDSGPEPPDPGNDEPAPIEGP